MTTHCFYIGIAECGCVRGALIDDERTTPEEVADFARRQQQMKRQIRHVEKVDWTPAPGCTKHAGESA